VILQICQGFSLGAGEISLNVSALPALPKMIAQAGLVLLPGGVRFPLKMRPAGLSRSPFPELRFLVSEAQMLPAQTQFESRQSAFCS
jgi:hypothetical protein